MMRFVILNKNLLNEDFVAHENFTMHSSERLFQSKYRE